MFEVAFVDRSAREERSLCFGFDRSIGSGKMSKFLVFRRDTNLALLSDCWRICTLSEEGTLLLVIEFVSSLNPSSIFSISSQQYLCLSPESVLLLMREESILEDEASSSTRIEKVIWFSKPFDSTSIVPLFYFMMLSQIS